LTKIYPSKKMLDFIYSCGYTVVRNRQNFSGETMKTIIFSFTILSLVVFGQGCEKRAKTPSDAFKIVQKAVLNENWEKYWDMLSSDSKKRFDNQVINMQQTFDRLSDQIKERMLQSMDLSYKELMDLDGYKFFVNFMRNKKSNDYSAKLFESCIIMKIETRDNRALLYLEDDEGNQEKLPVVQENDTWKLELGQYYSF